MQVVPRKRAPGQKLVPARKGAAGVPARLVRDLRELIRRARGGVARAVNAALVLLYWQVGQG